MLPLEPICTPGGHTKSQRKISEVSAGAAEVVVSAGAAAAKPTASAKTERRTDAARIVTRVD